MIPAKKYWLITTCLALALSATAQKKQYTMAEATNGIVTNLAPNAIKGAAWRPQTHQLYFNDNGRINVYDVQADNVATGSKESKALADAGHNTITWAGKDFYYTRSGDSLHFWGMSSDEGSDRNTVNFFADYVLSPGAENIHTDNSGLRVAFTEKNNLYLIDRDGRTKQVTNDADPNIINGQAVHRNEFGITEGIFFSPKGNYMAYYHMDQTMVADYPVIDWSTVPAKNVNVKYPMAGGASHQVTLRVYNPKTEQTIELQTGKGKDHYLTSVTWSPNEEYIYVAILNRAQNHLWLNQYDAQTGEKVKTLFGETDEKYVEPQHPLAFLPGSNDQFIWWSQRDGYMHLWLCDLVTNRMKCLTPGNYVVNDLLGFNARRSEVLLASAKADPREKHGYAVNWKTGEMRKLDTEPGTHNYIASEDGDYLYDVLTYEGDHNGSIANNSSSSEWFLMEQPQLDSLEKLKIAKRCLIRSVDGKVLKILVDSDDPLKDYDRPIIKNCVLKASDGTSLYGKLILPTNFDRNKKYPVIVYLYNGPHVQLIKNGFPASGNLWYEYLAQHGYIVWTMDGRGSSNRGQKFEQAVFRKLGTVEMEDQMQGVKFLKSLPYVDTKRMGIHGWSFGGFMTTSFMLRKPDVFKVGVAGGPVMDWSMYEIMYGERYMDTPEENPKGYADNNLLTKVKNLKGKLLLIHGAQDATVVWQHSINFLKKSVDENVQVDYFVYPGYEHNVRGKDRVHLMQKITDYFDQNL